MCVVIKLCTEQAVNSDYRESQESIGERRDGHFDWDRAGTSGRARQLHV